MNQGNVEFFHFFIKRGAMNAEQPGSLVLVVVADLDGLKQGFFFRIFPDILQDDRCRWRGFPGQAAEEDRQMLHANLILYPLNGAKYSFKNIGELTDIARPVIFFEYPDDFRRDSADIGAALFAHRQDEMLGDHRNIFLPFLQGGNVDWNDIDPVIEVLPEKSFSHPFLQVLVGGGD